MITNGVNLCNRKVNKIIFSNVSKTRERATNYYNVFVSTIKRIRREDKNNTEVILTTLGKRGRE